MLPIMDILKEDGALTSLLIAKKQIITKTQKTIALLYHFRRWHIC